MSAQMSFLDTPNVISSPASDCGLIPSPAQGGRKIVQSGQHHAHASPSARQAREQGLMMSGTYGQTSIGSPNSVALQLSLESKLKTLVGSTSHSLTWKAWDTPSGVSRLRLLASVLRTSGTEPIGLPTPSGTSNHGKNHVAGRLDEWGGSGNPWRGRSIGKLHLPSFEAWIMGIPVAWVPLMRSAMLSLPRSPRRSSKR